MQAIYYYFLRTPPEGGGGKGMEERGRREGRERGKISLRGGGQ